MIFTEPGDPTKICYREVDYKGDKYHFCSDHCKKIFEDEPEKYVQAWLPVHQIYQGNCFPRHRPDRRRLRSAGCRAEVLQPGIRPRQPRFRHLGR